MANGIQPPADLCFTRDQWRAAVRIALPVEERACCSGPLKSGQEAAVKAEPERRGLKGAVLSPLACKGGSTMSAAGLPPVPPAERPNQIAPAPALRVVVEAGPESWDSRSIDPVVPPPRA